MVISCSYKKATMRVKSIFLFSLPPSPLSAFGGNRHPLLGRIRTYLLHMYFALFSEC